MRALFRLPGQLCNAGAKPLFLPESLTGSGLPYGFVD
jgi:hypothetical protein